MLDAALAVGRTRNESPLFMVPDRFIVTPSMVVGQLVTVTEAEPSG